MFQAVRDWINQQYFEDDLFRRIGGFYIACLALLLLLFVVRIWGNTWIENLPSTNSILSILAASLVAIWAFLMQLRALLPKSSALYSVAASLTPGLPGLPPDIDSDFVFQFILALWLVYYILMIPVFLIIPVLKQFGIRGE